MPHPVGKKLHGTCGNHSLTNVWDRHGKSPSVAPRAGSGRGRQNPPIRRGFRLLRAPSLPPTCHRDGLASMMSTISSVRGSITMIWSRDQDELVSAPLRIDRHDPGGSGWNDTSRGTRVPTEIDEVDIGDRLQRAAPRITVVIWVRFSVGELARRRRPGRRCRWSCFRRQPWLRVVHAVLGCSVRCCGPCGPAAFMLAVAALGLHVLGALGVVGLRAHALFDFSPFMLSWADFSPFAPAFMSS